MTSYITINNTEVDPDSPITADLMTKMRDNPIAMAEGSVGSPFISAGWQPYDHLSGGSGLIYSSAVSGTVASFESPTFADEFEYMFIFDSVSTTSTLIFAVALYRETSAAYSTASTLFTLSSVGSSFSGYANINYPRRITKAHFFNGMFVEDASNSSTTGNQTNAVVTHTTSQKISKVRFSATSGSIDAGLVYMFRRRVKF